MNCARGLFQAALLLALAGCKDEIGDGRTTRQVTRSLAAPSNLAGSAQPGGSAVALTWTDNSSGEESYALERHDAPFNTGYVRDRILLPANATSYTYPTLRNTTYYFRVFAMTSSLQSDYSNVFSITTPDPPDAPLDLTAAAVSSSRIDLAWLNVLNETGFRIERSPDGGTTWSALVTLPADATSHSDTSLVADTEYCYRVFAVNADGDSLPSNTACAITQSASMTITTAAAAGDVGRSTSIAVTPGGIEHAAHYDATNSNVLHTTGAPGGPYSTATVDAGPTGTQDVGGSDALSLALDASGTVHVAAQDVTNRDLRYVTNAGGSFAATTIDSPGDVGRFARIRVSPAGGSIQIVYVEYLTSALNTLKRAVWSSGSWSFETFFTGESIFHPSFAIDGSGNPHVCFLHVVGGIEYRLVYGTKPGAAPWSFTTIDTVSGFKRGAIAFDPSGFPHVVFNGRPTTSDPESLLHATNASGAWVTEAVHQDPLGTAVLGRNSSIAIHPTTGRIHVAYYDATLRDLRYARKDPGGAWVLRLIDSAGDVGQDTSIALDGSGGVHIGYYDATNGNLKIASGAP
jgi:hypothetical protein